MRGAADTRPEAENQGNNAAMEWHNKWAALEALPHVVKRPIGKIIAFIVLTVVAVALATFLIVGGPARFGGAGSYGTPSTTEVAPAPALLQPAPLDAVPVLPEPSAPQR